MSNRPRRAVSISKLGALCICVLGAGCTQTESDVPPVAVAVSALTEVDTCAELQAMRNGLDGDYVLTSDVDCSAYDYGDDGGFRPVGQGGSVWEPFTGTFDGQGHVISGLTIDRPELDGVGLFGLIFEAEVSNVGIEDASISGGAWVGALVGTVLDSTVSESYSTGDVNGLVDTGGLFGQVKGGGSEVRDCYSLADVTGNNARGLVIAEVSYDGDVARVYSAGTSSADAVVAAEIANGGTVADSFFDCTVAGNCMADGAASTSEMKDDPQYGSAGWDFEDVWGWHEVTGYPCLRWQASCGDGCATRVPYYETACLDDLQEDADATAALAAPAYGDPDTDYPTLGADVLPTPPTLPTPAGTATASTLGQLESAVNGGNVTVTLTANIDGRADLWGENVILDLNGYRVDQIALSGDGYGNATGGAQVLEIRNGTVGSIDHIHATDVPADITLRGLTFANDLASSIEDNITLGFGGMGIDRVLIVNCVAIGHASSGMDLANATFLGSHMRDVIIANSNFGTYLSNEPGDAGWTARHAHGGRFLIVDSWMRADHNPSLRTGDDGYVVWTTPSHRGDARKTTVINHNHPYLRIDWINGTNDRSLDLFVKFVAGNAYDNAVVYGGSFIEGDQSPLYLARGLEVIQQASGLFDGTVLAGLETSASSGESWDYDVNGENTYSTSWAIPGAPDICNYLDDGDTICPPESDPYSVVP